MSIEKLSTSASLKDVIDKFEEISFQDFSSVNIITASELPSKGKEGQLCIITNITPNNIFLDYKERELSENDIFIQTNIPSNDNGYYNVSPYVDNGTLKLQGNVYLANLTIINKGVVLGKT